MPSKIANQRHDFQDQLSRKLVEENQSIGLEDLNVRGRLSDHHLAESIGEAGWSAFVRMPGIKGEWYGCRVEKISRWSPSSKTCPVCGTKMAALPLKVRLWRCPVCETVRDRDVKAAINSLKRSTAGVAGHLRRTAFAAVQVSNAWGQSVRPSPDGNAG